MARNFTSDTLILSTHQMGEKNRSVCVLTAEEGVFYTTLYGGPKSRFRSLVCPWNRGTMWLYRDEVKKTCKITDFDVRKYHLTFRESLYKSWAASLATEVVIKTKCAGSPQQCWTLINGFLDGMDLCNENESQLGLIRFIWRYLILLGIQPDTHHCARCGKSFLSGKITPNTVPWNGSYDTEENGFICEDCAALCNQQFCLNTDAFTYLEAITNLDPKSVRAIMINECTVNMMKRFCFSLIENACGSPLKSLKSGIGIL